MRPKVYEILEPLAFEKDPKISGILEPGEPAGGISMESRGAEPRASNMAASGRAGLV